MPRRVDLLLQQGCQGRRKQDGVVGKGEVRAAFPGAVAVGGELNNAADLLDIDPRQLR